MNKPTFKWESIGAAAYYGLGFAYYAYKWIILLGLGNIVAAILLRSRLLLFVVLLNAGIVLIVAGAIAWIAKTKKRLQLLNPDLEFLKEINTYEISSGHHYRYTKVLAFCPRRFGITTYLDKIKWTGGGPVAVRTDDPRAEVTLLPGQNELYDTLRIVFSEPLRRHKTKRLTVILEMTDEAGNAKPYLAKTVHNYYPRGFTLKVILPEDPREAGKRIVFSIYPNVAIWESELKHPGREIPWRVRSPRMDLLYRIEWTLPMNGSLAKS